MTSVRLGKEIEQLLDEFTILEGVSRSEIIKEALQEYFKTHFVSDRPFDIGKDFFGRYGSGITDNSVKYKEKIKEKVHEKYSH